MHVGEDMRYVVVVESVRYPAVTHLELLLKGGHGTGACSGGY